VKNTCVRVYIVCTYLLNFITGDIKVKLAYKIKLLFQTIIFSKKLDTYIFVPYNMSIKTMAVADFNINFEIIAFWFFN